MNPLAFRQESPPTRQGRRAVGGLFVKAGIFGPRGESVSSAKPAVQESIPGAKQLTLDIGHTPSVPTPTPKTSGPQLSLPMGGGQHELPHTGTVQPATPSKPSGGGLITPGTASRPGTKVSPASAVGSSARTSAEHQSMMAQKPTTSLPAKPQKQYGSPIGQKAKPGEQTTLPGVAVHQQAHLGGAGTQLDLPGGAAMHTPTGKEPKPAKPETIGQAESRATAAAQANVAAADVANLRHKQTFGGSTAGQREAQTQARGKELEVASTAAPVGAVGSQMALPGMSTHSRREQSRAAGQLAAHQSMQEGKPSTAGEQATFGSMITKEQGPKTEAGKVGQTMRTGSPAERSAAIKQSAAAMRQRAEASGRQQPKAATQPEFKPSKAGEDHHSNLSGYHTQMADHHEHLAKQTGDSKQAEAANAHRAAAQLHGGKSKANSLSEKAHGHTKKLGTMSGEADHATLSEHHQQIYNATGDQRHKAAADAHRSAHQAHAANDTARAFGHSDNAERLSREAGVEGALTQRVKQTGGKPGMQAAPPESIGPSAAGEAAGRGTPATRTPVGAGSRGGRPVRGSASYGVASPNIMGNFASGYGMGLASGSLAGPMFQTAMLAQQGAGKLQSLASARQRYLPRQAQQEQARDAQTAAHQRTAQLQQTYLAANKSISESPPVRSGMRRF